MKARFILAALTALVAIQSSAQDAPVIHRNLNLYANQVKVLPCDPLTRVAVGNGKLLSVSTLTHQIVMVADAPGTTDVYLWEKNGQQIAYHVNITAADNLQIFTDLQGLLTEFPGVAARTTGRQVVLSGNASTGELKRLNLAIRAYPGVVNLVRPDTVAMKRMVVLDVQVVDFSKNALDNLGINWQTSIVGPAVGLVGDFVNNSLYRLGDVTQGGQAGNTLNGPQGGISGLPLNVPPFSSYAGIVSSITSQINLAVQNGQAYILANPRLVTRSGGTATFLAGGEVPIPVSAGFGAVSVTYKNYGVKLKIQPDVDHQGNILATVNTAISQINPALTVQGYPAFLTRKTDSVVNVHSGQTIVLSGLIHATGANSINKLPWLGDIPILGTLFRDTQFQHNQSELVIFVTPEVINPNSPVNRAMIRQGRQDITRFNRDFQHGYFVPGVGHDPNQVGYPNFTTHVAPTAATESTRP